MRKITMLCVLLVSTSVLQATPVDITFTEDDIIQNGDSYNYVYLYNGGTGQTTVEMTGGSVYALVLYDDSHFIQQGGYIQDVASTWDTSTLDILYSTSGYITTHETSTCNLYSGLISYMQLQDDSVTNIYGGRVTNWIRLEHSATLNIFGGDFSDPPDFSFYYVVNPTVNVYYLTRTYTAGTYTGILADGSPFLLDSSFNYIEIPEPSTLLLLGLGALILRRRR